MKSVVIYRGGNESGLLAKFRDGSYEFRYLRNYRCAADSRSVAFALPKTRAVHRSAKLFPFFAGLLAEGVQKELQCRSLRIDERDLFTRLAETCRAGTVGAVSVLPRKGFRTRIGK